MKESNGKFTMLTRPCIFTEKTEKRSDQGDILLTDFKPIRYRFEKGNANRYVTARLFHDGRGRRPVDRKPRWPEPVE